MMERWRSLFLWAGVNSGREAALSERITYHKQTRKKNRQRESNRKGTHHYRDTPLQTQGYRLCPGRNCCCLLNSTREYNEKSFKCVCACVCGCFKRNLSIDSFSSVLHFAILKSTMKVNTMCWHKKICISLFHFACLLLSLVTKCVAKEWQVLYIFRYFKGYSGFNLAVCDNATNYNQYECLREVCSWLSPNNLSFLLKCHY